MSNNGRGIRTRREEVQSALLEKNAALGWWGIMLIQTCTLLAQVMQTMHSASAYGLSAKTAPVRGKHMLQGEGAQ